jgi:uncharacterized protein YndB with AHSA1/START domain
MPTTLITSDQDAIVSDVHIAAPPERVFQALIDPQQLMRWWTSERPGKRRFCLGHCH